MKTDPPPLFFVFLKYILSTDFRDKHLKKFLIQQHWGVIYLKSYLTMLQFLHDKLLVFKQGWKLFKRNASGAKPPSISDRDREPVNRQTRAQTTVKKVLHAMHDENKVRERRGIETYKSGSLFTNYNIVILRNR